jgi:hypothetical protein
LGDVPDARSWYGASQEERSEVYNHTSVMVDT